MPTNPTGRVMSGSSLQRSRKVSVRLALVFLTCAMAQAQQQPVIPVPPDYVFVHDAASLNTIG